MFWFKKKDPVCGVKEEKDEGIYKYNNWFCSEKCLNIYERKIKSLKKGGCCG